MVVRCRAAFCRVVLSIVTITSTSVGASDLAEEAESALKKAGEYFRKMVSTNGGYLWVYSEDLKERAGEGKATETQIWVQPPGTPSVGFAYLRAYEATGDPFYLEAAKAAADALVWGQLESGGWDYRIDFDPERSRRWYYRHDKGKVDPKGRRNTSTFDDNNSQSALRFVMAVHKTTQEQKHLSAVKYGLAFMLRSQFENGAWPQRYPLASVGYSRWYTFNDNAINDCISVMLDAYDIYGNEKYLDSARRGGDFIITSQLPEPQAGWAQQYDHDMNPAPARWFEPAGVNGAVTARNIGTLIDLYLKTGEQKYFKSIPAAIDWLERSRMENGKWARFYELGSNRPIYVNMDKKVVYEFVNIRPGYSWMGDYASSAIKLYEEVKNARRKKYLARRDALPTRDSQLSRMAKLGSRVRNVIEQQDERGRWVDKGQIRCSTFIRNTRLLSDYIALSHEVAHDGDRDITGKRSSYGALASRASLGNPTRKAGKLPLDRWRRHFIDDLPKRSMFIEAGDLDGDGDKDLAAGGWWWENTGGLSGKWVRHEVGDPLRNLACMHDFDGDGDLDILGTEGVGAASNRDFVWARNNGSGGFEILDNIDYAGGGDFLQGCVVGNLGRGLRVVLSWHRDGGGIYALNVPRDPSSRRWTTTLLSKTVSSPPQGEDLSLGDIDRDGDLDLLLGEKWLRNDGDNWPTFVLGKVTEGEPDRVDLADVNGDGRLDAVVSLENGTDVLWYEAPKNPTERWDRHQIGIVAGQGFSMDTADFDNDGDPDVVIGEHRGKNKNRIVMFENAGHGAEWKEHVIDSGPKNEIDHHDGVQAVDLDHDGDLDLISIGWYNPKVWVYENLAVD